MNWEIWKQMMRVVKNQRKSSVDEEADDTRNIF